PQRAYVTVSGFGSGHVFRTVNRGGSWQDISSNLIDVPVNAILRLPGSDELYVGTDLGVFQSGDDGLTWAPSATGMPNVAVLDLAFQNVTQTIVAATHGRGMFAHTVAGVGALRGDVSLDGQVSAMDAQGILTGVAGLAAPGGVRVIHTERQRLGARHVHEAEHGQELEAVRLGELLLAQLAREALPFQVAGEAELVGVWAHGARVVNRPFADLVLDRLEH